MLAHREPSVHGNAFSVRRFFDSKLSSNRCPSSTARRRRAGGLFSCHPDRAKRVEGSVDLNWSALIATPIDPSARTLRDLGRDNIPTGLPRPARRNVISPRLSALATKPFTPATADCVRFDQSSSQRRRILKPQVPNLRPSVGVRKSEFRIQKTPRPRKTGER